jgi:sugar phosphate isomerase/epimerase
MFGSPLEEQPMDLLTLQGWKECIDYAHHFGARVVAGFTGRIRGQPLTEVWRATAKSGLILPSVPQIVASTLF